MTEPASQLYRLTKGWVGGGVLAEAKSCAVRSSASAANARTGRAKHHHHGVRKPAHRGTMAAVETTEVIALDYFAATLSFVRAAELSSFSKAAQVLAIKSSTVSRHIGELERDLRIALFNRSTRGLVLTEGGRTFLPLARRALAALEEARESTAGLNHSPRGRLRVLLPGAFARRMLLPHLSAFMTAFPDITIDAVVSDEQLPLIEAGFDLAINIGAPGDSGLMGRRLLTVREHLCATQDYLRQHGTPTRPDELSRHIGLTGGRSEDTPWHFRHGDTEELMTIRPHSRFHSSDPELLLGLAGTGHGIALLPQWLLGDRRDDGKLHILLDEWQASSERGGADIWALYPPKKTVSSKVRAFVDFFAGRLGEPSPAEADPVVPDAHN